MIIVTADILFVNRVTFSVFIVAAVSGREKIAGQNFVLRVATVFLLSLLLLLILLI